MGLFGKPDAKPSSSPSLPVPANVVTAPPPAPPRPSTVIGEKTNYVGKIETSEPILILGSFDGDIRSTSIVTVGEGGRAKATITAREISISGDVNGDCSATERIELRPSGRLVGSVHSPKIAIGEGAQFRGTSETGSKKA